MDAGSQADLTATDWQRLSALFDELADLPTGEREAQLAALQPPELVARLRRMLASLPDDDATVLVGPTGFNTQLAHALNNATEHTSRPAEPGDRLGAWCLAELLGEGGMGQVWRAERADGLYQGEAAIKLLRDDLAGPGLAARFARERALLGRLTHPGIARLLDAGEQDGRAFLVLEYVAGRTLSEHVREMGLGLVERVKLLIEVARAVEHAHAQLIVHRDLKPSNVMVEDVRPSLAGTRAVPRGDAAALGSGPAGGYAGQTKLLDFGIAGLLDDSGQQADSQLTQISGRRLTPAYAAPEQIAGGPIGVATDIYSLGVMLYELASGRLPFGQRGASRTAMEHAVLHGEALRITRTVGLGETHTAGTDAGPGRPADVTRAAGDLEAVAAKALRKDPAERYASVAGFIDDLQCWLAQRPVSVRAEDWRHRTHLWFRRNAALALGGSLVLAALSVGLGVSLWQRDEAQAAARQSEEVTRYLTELLASANPDKHGGHIPTIFEVLEKSRVNLQQRFAGDDLTYIRVLDVLVVTYSDMNRHDIAIPLAKELIAVNARHWGDDAEPTLIARLRLARIYTALGSPLEVIALCEPMLPAFAAARPGTLLEDEYESMLYQLIVSYAGVARIDDALATHAKAWPLVQKIYKPSDYEYVYYNNYMYQLRLAEGKLLEAEQTIASTRPSWATAPAHRARFVQRQRMHLWTMQARLGRPEGSVENAHALIKDIDALMGPGNSSSQRMRGDLARHFVELGQYAEAVQVYAEQERGLPAEAAEHPTLRLPRESAALLARALAQPERAAEWLPKARRVADELASSPDISGPPRVEASLAVARVGLRLGDLALARGALAPLLDLQAQPWLQPHAQLRSRIAQLQGELARANGRRDAGVAELRQRVQLLDSLQQPQGLPHWRAQLDLAASLIGTPEAAAALQRADALRPDWLQSHPLDTLRAELGRGQWRPQWGGQL
ncbi:serine/threonine-protein kinase [Roseateles asaccharophilus]|uniref:Serine/threonine-protein kinase n=1 Tax=Roseateles asaccharophilus TaxID=582607 RepID=A0ABU2ADE1_9BURK|nr:serine/threonine-protein kinase [Roseateles asaccharophilus]MDR7335228.1 serine/threonine-protein kinase [Roseateles asaccharophilus]